MRVFDAPEPRVGRASTSRVVPARVIAYPRARTARDSDASSASSSSGEDVSDDDEEEEEEASDAVARARHTPLGTPSAPTTTHCFPSPAPTRDGKTRTRRFARLFARNTDRGWWY